MPNHLYEISELFAQARTGGKVVMRLPPEEILQRDFAADGLDLNRALNRMESCLVAMALKRRQLFWEELFLYPDFCFRPSLPILLQVRIYWESLPARNW